MLDARPKCAVRAPGVLFLAEYVSPACLFPSPARAETRRQVNVFECLRTTTIHCIQELTYTGYEQKNNFSLPFLVYSTRPHN
jgi:hypothetical protein